jgi:acid phosphatase (class A)
MKRILPLLLASTVALASVHAQPAPAPAAKTFELLDPAAFVPDQMLPAPAPAGSVYEKQEMAMLRQIIASASPARMEQAKWDDEHEDPAIFDQVLGLKLASLPATWALLKTVQHEADLTADLAKVHFARVRPWGVDSTLPNCDAGKGKQPTRSYPSGHSSLGYSVGWILAELMPDKASVILARANDYALSREICGVHFPSDTEASHVLGTLTAARLYADPRLAARIAAARAELAAK